MNERLPLRVLHLTLASDAGGLSRYIHDLCTAMHRDGHFVAVAGDVGVWQGLFDDSPFPYLKIPLKAGVGGFLRSRQAVMKFCEEHRIDVLHTHYRRATRLARWIRTSRGRPEILYTLHLSHLNLSGHRRWLTDFGDHTHVASVDARRWLEDEGRVNQAHISLIPHGVDVARYTPASSKQRSEARRLLGLKDDDLVAVFVGRLDTPKNEHWMVDVAEAARDTIPNLKVLIVGEGPHELAVRTQIAALALQDRVTVLGYRSPLPVYHAADALLLPSAREGFSLVCAEAMACGVPVFRTRTSGTTELIIEGVTGRSVDIDRRAFIDGAAAFLSDLVALQRMGNAALAHVRQTFAYETQVSRTLDLYRWMLDAKRCV